jgi:hypothetical protein
MQGRCLGSAGVAVDVWVSGDRPPMKLVLVTWHADGAAGIVKHGAFVRVHIKVVAGKYAGNR